MKKLMILFTLMMGSATLLPGLEIGKKLKMSLGWDKVEYKRRNYSLTVEKKNTGNPNNDSHMLAMSLLSAWSNTHKLQSLENNETRIAFSNDIDTRKLNWFLSNTKFDQFIASVQAKQAVPAEVRNKCCAEANKYFAEETQTRRNVWKGIYTGTLLAIGSIAAYQLSQRYPEQSDMLLSKFLIFLK